MMNILQTNKQADDERAPMSPPKINSASRGRPAIRIKEQQTKKPAGIDPRRVFETA